MPELRREHMSEPTLLLLREAVSPPGWLPAVGVIGQNRPILLAAAVCCAENRLRGQRRRKDRILRALPASTMGLPGRREINDNAVPLRIFSEARLHRGSDGGIFARDVADGSTAWDRYVDFMPDAELVARVGPVSTAAQVATGRIRIYPMPFYEGPRDLLRCLPDTLNALHRATAGTRCCLIRLPGAQGLMAGTIARIRSRPYAVEVVGDARAVLQSGVAGRLGRVLAPLGAAAMRWVVRGAAAGRFVTTSQLQAFYPLATGAPAHAYSNVALGANDFVDRPRVFDRASSRLIAVGTQDQLYKGHDDLIRAVALLAAHCPDVELVIVGDGRHHEDLKNLAATCGVADRVRFTGRVNGREKLSEELDQADLFVQPSRTEGLPRALIEAMARGLPAVATSVGGCPELLGSSQLVRAGDPQALADVISSHLSDPALLTVASSRNLARARDFDEHKQERRINAWLAELESFGGKTR